MQIAKAEGLQVNEVTTSTILSSFGCLSFTHLSECNRCIKVDFHQMKRRLALLLKI